MKWFSLFVGLNIYLLSKFFALFNVYAIGTFLCLRCPCFLRILVVSLIKKKKVLPCYVSSPDTAKVETVLPLNQQIPQIIYFFLMLS